MNREQEITDWNAELNASTAEEIVAFAVNKFKTKLALASSLGAEDQVLTHLLLQAAPKSIIFTLDTGRLFPETYDLIAHTCARYKTKIQVYTPEACSLQSMVNTHGVNLFYNSVEERKLCCQVRKLEPLSRAFQGLEAWMCGLRAAQSITRNEVQVIAWDEQNKLIKINPLARWSEAQLWEYIHQYNIPYNPLHKKGFPSIGCQPCTRAIEEGEDVRAGRWWWENPETKECGLHKR